MTLLVRSCTREQENKKLRCSCSYYTAKLSNIRTLVSFISVENDAVGRLSIAYSDWFYTIQHGIEDGWWYMQAHIIFIDRMQFGK